MIAKITTFRLNFIILCLFACYFSLQAQDKFDDYFLSGTLRFDYIITGNKDTAIISPHKFKKEPHWGGSITSLIDYLEYGEMLFKIYDTTDNRLIYSRGYSNLFIEWQTTSEAEKITRSFFETVVMPLPKNVVLIEIYIRKRNQEFQLLYNQEIDPGSYFISMHDALPFDTMTILHQGHPSKNIDFVIIPEGYTIDEMDKFKNDARRFTSYFLNWVPFNDYANRFNFYAVLAPSRQKGTSIPGELTWRNTLLNSSFYTFNDARYLTTVDTWKVRDIAAIVPYDQIIILVNSERYGGGGIFNNYSIFTSDHSFSEVVFLHEIGHGFASLADEYFSSDVAYADFYDLSVEPYHPNITTLVNFDAKWADMIGDDIPVPTPNDDVYKGKVGVFEGGGYTDKGIYRPSLDCTMKSLIHDGFCPVCIRAIEDMILFYIK